MRSLRSNKYSTKFKGRRKRSSKKALPILGVATVGLFGLAVITSQPSVQAANAVAGQLFIDYDRNGSPLDINGNTATSETTPNFAPSTIGGTTAVTWSDFGVTATDSAGASANGVINPADGTYSINTSSLAGTSYMIELSVPGDYQAAIGGSQTGATSPSNLSTTNPLISWIDSESDLTDYNIGAQPPSSCDMTGGGQLFTTCFINGDDQAGGLNDAFVGLNYDGTGKQLLGTKQNYGSIWGVAYDEWSGTAYTSAILKRHADLGPEGLDGLYWLDYTGAAATAPSGSASLETVSGQNYGGTGFDGRLNGVQSTDSSTDAAAFPEIANTGIGDIDLTDDGKTLLVTNLETKSIDIYDVSSVQVNPATGSPVYVNSYAVPDPGCANFRGYNNQPWAISAVDSNTAYAGTVCADATLGAIYELDLTNGFDATPFSTLPASYFSSNRGCTVGNSDENCRGLAIFEEWAGTWAETNPTNDGTRQEVPYSQAIIGDIGISADGSLEVAVIDRTAHQTGFRNLDTSGNGNYSGYSGGDIIHINPNGSMAAGVAPTTFAWESGVVNEYYAEDWWGGNNPFNGVDYNHSELTVGGLWVHEYQNRQEVVVASFDAVNDIDEFNSGGLDWYSTTPGGANTNEVNLYTRNDTNVIGGTFSKSGGIGDVEGCSLPVELGDWIWIDSNADGIQNAGDEGLPGATVTITGGSLPAAGVTTTTDSRGYYNFNWSHGLLAGETYTITVDTNTSPETDGSQLLTIQNAGGNDQLDSDANEADGAAGGVYTMTTTPLTHGETNHTYDLGILGAHDLALKKITDAEFVRPGEDVTFTIEVSNQTGQTEYNVQVTDYIPAGFELNDSNWTAAGTGIGPDTATYTFTDQFDPLDDASGNDVQTIDITLTVSDPYTGPQQIVNEAEISAFTDEDGNPVEDADSIPDGIQGNDAGGTVNTPGEDDETEDDGTTDEDDHDPEDVLIEADLALIKQLDSGNSEDPVVTAGEDVTFDIAVTNQGYLDAHNIVVTDYIPAGFTLNDTNWAASGSNATTTIVGPLAPGATHDLQITLQLDGPYTGTSYTVLNEAEISSFQDVDGNIAVDIDSTPDADNTNDNGQGADINETPDTDDPSDDFIDGDAKSNADDDEDDQDGENILVLPDLALNKVGDKDEALMGEDITYTITVTNQGSLDAYSILVVDHVPAGQTFIDTSGVWFTDATLTTPATNPTDGPLTIYASIDGPLTSQGGTAQLSLLTEGQEPWPVGADPAVHPRTVNYAEIADFEDGEGNKPTDIDSTPDDDNTNDDGGAWDSANDDHIDGNGKADGGAPLDEETATDEDDHDPHDVLILLDDLALSKVITTIYHADGSTASVNDTVPATDPMTIPQVEPGDDIEYEICVWNQGYRDVFDVQIVDYIPEGLIYSANDNNGWLNGTPGVTTNASVMEEFNQVQTAFPGIDPMTETDPHAFRKVCQDIRLTVADPYTGGANLVNRAEVYEAFDEDGAPIVDIDSEEESSENDGGDADPGGTPGDPQEDNWVMDRDEFAIDNNDDGVIDEDDEDPALVQLPVDLSLTKTTDFTGLAYANEKVTFEICIVNQGMVEMAEVDIIDYLPVGLSLDPADPNWSAGTEPNTAIATLFGPVLVDGTPVCIDIMTIVDDPIVVNSPLVNVAEIYGARDNNDDEVADLDEDSTPDSDLGNDTGGEVGEDTDNHIIDDGQDGNGDGITDEDDHDPASIELAQPDLALVKKIAQEDQYAGALDTATFTITVTNQGNVPAQNIQVTDYIPAGLELTVADQAGWSAAGAGPTTVTQTIPGPLAPGASTDLTITLTVDGTVTTSMTNYSEISAAENENGEPLGDIDSTPDSDNTNDLGGEDDTESDDHIEDDGSDTNGDGITDEDDHDSENIQYGVYDLALIKTTESDYVVEGSTVTFTLTVTNQGDLPTSNTTIADYVPAGYTLSPDQNLDWTTDLAGSTPVVGGETGAVYTTIPGTLAPGDGTAVNIMLVVENPFDGTEADLVNFAEIAAFTNQDSETRQDIDSTPDSDNTNDLGGQVKSSSDNHTDDDGQDTNGDGITDEDDHDPATVRIGEADLALRKTLASGQDSAVAPGEDVLFTIEVFNQGQIAAYNIELIDYLDPSIMTLSEEDDNNWSSEGTSAVTTIPEAIASGSSATIDILVTLVEEVEDGPLDNLAEITSFEDNTGFTLSDVDSTPDNQNTDELTNDEIDDDGTIDEDDHDIATITIDNTLVETGMPIYMFTIFGVLMAAAGIGVSRTGRTSRV